MRSADANNTAGDRNYLGLAKPKVIMNDIRLRAPAVADNNTFDRESVHNHAQTARTLSAPYERGSRARLVQAEGLDSQAAPTSRIRCGYPN
jgi:hypothetical protein